MRYRRQKEKRWKI